MSKQVSYPICRSTRQDVVSYLVDSIGFSLEEAEGMTRGYLNPEDCLSRAQVLECRAFNGKTR